MGRRVRDVMTLEVVTVGGQASFKEIAATMAERRVSALSVLDEEGRVGGIVTLSGQLERRRLIPITVSLVHGIDGVVDVVDRLTFEVDDSPVMVPSDLLMTRAPSVRRQI